MHFLQSLFLFIKKIYQSLFFNIIFPIYTLFFWVPITLFFMIFRIFPLAAWSIHSWARSVFFIAGQKISIEGLENIDPEKRYVIIANHGSFSDILAISIAISQPVSWILKEGLLKIPGLNILFKLGVGIPIKRSDARTSQKIISQNIMKLKNGWNPHIIIYPEGTRSLTGSINPFKRGFIKIMKEYELDILPITLCGFHNFYKPKAKFADPSSQLKIIIHPPQKFDKLTDIDEKDLAREMQTLIAEKYYA
ncbi:MAG: lysophospholipid acyltransferase family protein [Brevinema sp.]